VSGSVLTQFGSQDQNSTSATNSRNNSIQTTRLASSRVKQSHKMTISTTTVTGTSEATTRMLENPSATNPMRIDYFSLMSKWYVALYRYGLRLTYDITVPEPGATLRENFALLDILQKTQSAQFSFTVKHSDITTKNYPVLADQYSVDVPPPPAPKQFQTLNDVELSNQISAGYKPKTINVPDGYWITQIIFTDLQLVRA
jgi:hypothetical protein